MNAIKEKILLLLLGGLAFGCSYTPHQQWRVLKTVSCEWKRLNKKELRDGINYLYRLNYIDKDKSANGTMFFSLSKKGKLWTLNHKLENIKNKQTKWDKKWRMVAFDIPEKYRVGRNALRLKLKKIGFCELQKSVLITPYECKEEIRALVEYFKLNKHVRFAVLESVDNEGDLRKIFKLSLHITI